MSPEIHKFHNPCIHLTSHGLDKASMRHLIHVSSWDHTQDIYHISPKLNLINLGSSPGDQCDKTSTLSMVLIRVTTDQNVKHQFKPTHYNEANSIMGWKVQQLRPFISLGKVYFWGGLTENNNWNEDFVWNVEFYRHQADLKSTHPSCR